VPKRAGQSSKTLITDFRLAVREALHQVNLHSDQMTLAADSLKTIATESSHRAQAAAASTSEASSNVNTVARAAEELSASIAEIESQVTRTRGVVLDASRVTAHTTQAIDGLAEKANEIGEVIGLIQAIAAQNNLLALNATIEAARAGGRRPWVCSGGAGGEITCRSDGQSDGTDRRARRSDPERHLRRCRSDQIDCCDNEPGRRFYRRDRGRGRGTGGCDERDCAASPRRRLARNPPPVTWKV